MTVEIWDLIQRFVFYPKPSGGKGYQAKPSGGAVLAEVTLYTPFLRPASGDERKLFGCREGSHLSDCALLFSRWVLESRGRSTFYGSINAL